jgi:hypothetical protein
LEPGTYSPSAKYSRVTALLELRARQMRAPHQRYEVVTALPPAECSAL